MMPLPHAQLVFGQPSLTWRFAAAWLGVPTPAEAHAEPERFLLEYKPTRAPRAVKATPAARQERPESGRRWAWLPAFSR